LQKKDIMKLFLIAVALVCAAGCGKNDEAEAARILGVTVTAQDRTAANEIFSTRCSVCHGSMGAGDGPASKGLSPQPRNFQDKSWQASVSNEYITKIIREGGTSVGKSATMPANSDLLDKGGVVAALTGEVRRFGR
jgi:mono/diheme cytochrome c family protein